MPSVLPIFVLVFCVFGNVSGHGRLWEPPGRSSLWRFGYDNPANYNDNELFCGGYSYQWQSQGGKCGECGDPYDRARENQAGGRYANGIITRNYESGQTIDVEVWVTANHIGWFEFRLCPNNNIHSPVTQACLDQYLLPIEGSGTRWAVTPGNEIKYMRVRLPAGLTCSQCVVQWKYNTGNSWGRDPDTGRECLGCGPQEQFYGCSDIAIGDNNGGSETLPPPATTGSPPTNVPSTDPTPSPWPTAIEGVECNATGVWEGNEAMDAWCQENCTHLPAHCPEETCVCRAVNR